MIFNFALVACMLLGTTETVHSESKNAVRIQVDPFTIRQIDGISALDRKKYFNLADHGVKFEQRTQNSKIFNRITKDLRVHFGRSLGPVQSATGNGEKVIQDKSRRQFVDVNELSERLKQKQDEPSSKMLRLFGSNLGVAAHGSKNCYPKFMGQYYSDVARKDKHAHWLPENVEAAAELAATVFKYRFNNFDRPEFFEPINEPHWSYYNDPKLADWHLAVKNAFKKYSVPTKVGGMCMSVCYMYNQNYRSFNGYRNFLDNTKGELDFYSFHVYDYLDFENSDFVGRIQSGLPLEGVFDLVANYSQISFEEEKPIVVSEHGGYVSENRGKHPDVVINEIAEQYFPGRGFDWEMEKRSILDFNLVSSILTNTMNFMEHPHVVQKAVPFILLDSMGWNPKYYATLYTPFEFKNTKNWVATRNSDFFEFCSELKGHRVKMYSSDPDVQLRAFVNGKKLQLLINNLSNESHSLNFKIPKAQKYSMKRLGRAKDFRPYLKESTLTGLQGLDIEPRESLLITAEYTQEIKAKRTINEIPFYGKGIIKEAKGKSGVTFRIDIDELGDIDYAMLRIGFRRPPGTDRAMSLRFNGKSIKLPIEDCAERLENDKDFASTRFAYINPKLLKTKNSVNLRFPDGNGGTVGSVVLRIAKKVSSD